MEQIWQEKIDILLKKRKDVAAAGGEARIAKQHDLGKLTARERLEILFDEGSFVETNGMVTARATEFGMDQKKRPGDGVITGYGRIHGRLTFAAAQDFTVGGGALGEAHALKICNAMDKALELKVPFITINDSGGARIEEGIDSMSGYAEIFYRSTMASGVIPQIAVILGPCAGGASYSTAICDFVFMAEKSGQMYCTGPAVIKSVTGEEITASALGGAAVHGIRSGGAQFVYADDESCLNGVRELLGYLPQSNDSDLLLVKGQTVDACGKIPELIPGDPGKAYDVHRVIETFVDLGSFFEVHANFAPNLVVGFARMDGETMGIVANQTTHLAGALEMDAADKGARFIRFCDCFNIPVLTLVDTPAFFPDVEQEHRGGSRHGAKLLFAYAEATVPKVSLILRKAYGGAYVAMNSKGIGADMVYALPTAEIAVMGAAGAVAVIGRRAIKEAEDPAAKRQELIKEYNEKFVNPYVSAEHGYVDEVILPEEIREKILLAFRMLSGKQKSLPYKKHGNIPL